jgi:hypothetical protein
MQQHGDSACKRRLTTDGAFLDDCQGEVVFEFSMLATTQHLSLDLKFTIKVYIIKQLISLSGLKL